VLDLVFCILDREQKGAVSFSETVAGLCMICDAPLEEKLGFAFALFDPQNKGATDQEAVFRFMFGVR
jgi:Ca2+-binding EF-hand superfamily protein